MDFTMTKIIVISTAHGACKNLIERLTDLMTADAKSIDYSNDGTGIKTIGFGVHADEEHDDHLWPVLENTIKHVHRSDFVACKLSPKNRRPESWQGLSNRKKKICRTI